MRILLVNPPYQTWTSNWGIGHQVPLGLLLVGGALRDSGHEVRLLDAEAGRLTIPAVARAARDFRPDAVMTGHAGSTPAHPVCLQTLRAVKAAVPTAVTVYGGVYPTYHAAEILEREPAVNAVVRGEGEATAAELADALRAGLPLPAVAGLACRDGGRVVLTPERPPLHDLDRCRAAWELVEDWDRYRCFGLGRAAVVQFSRGCPHRCTYCGQHGFWVRWRHRDPAAFADEVEWLYRAHGVRFVTLADENPTTLPDVWRCLLEELAARRLPVHIFATIRATDVVRDAALLPLYRAAGMLYVLMGVESTDGEVLRRINKGSTPEHDVEACRLLRRNGIFSVLGQVVGFEDETAASLRRARRRLARYEADWLNAMYVTPHDWTPLGREAVGRAAEPDQARWDYRHQVLPQKHLRPWQLFLWVKLTELWFHLRPGRLWGLLRERDRFRRRQLLWVLLHVGLVWVCEVLEFVGAALRRPGRPGVGGRRGSAPAAGTGPEPRGTRRVPLLTG